MHSIGQTKIAEQLVSYLVSQFVLHKVVCKMSKMAVGLELPRGRGQLGKLSRQRKKERSGERREEGEGYEGR